MAYRRRKYRRPYRKNANRKRTRYNRRRRYSRRIARVSARSILRFSETKYFDLNTFHELYHNGGTGAVINWVHDYNMLQCIQGNTQFTRVGDKVWGKGLKIKMWLSNKGDRPNVIYRIFAITIPQDQLGNTTPLDLWSGVISGANFLLEILNTDKYKVIYNKYITVQSTSKWTVDVNPALNREKEVSRMHSFYLPLNRMISYSANNGAVPKYQRDIIGIGVIAYDATGTIPLDNIASYRLKSRFYFKDP